MPMTLSSSVADTRARPWLGLTLNEAKTSVRDGRKESFDFLGTSFGPHRYRKDGHWYPGASPSKTSVARLEPKVRGRPGNQAPWPPWPPGCATG